MSTDGDTDVFAAERPRLVGLAYRILGSRAEAEDVAQEAWLAWNAADTAAIHRPAAWLTTVAARLSLDRLRSARHRRETYVGPWLPEPVLGDQPAEAAELADSLALGFLVLLESLEPLERVVVVMADVYGMPFPEIAATVGRSPAACRQVASRARRRLRAGRPRLSPRPEADGVVARLLAAVEAADLAAVVALLAEDAVLVSDGGASRRAARRPVLGAGRVARVLISVASRLAPTAICRVPVNGQPGMVVGAGRAELVGVFEVVGGRVAAVYLCLAPEKLAGLPAAAPGG